MKPDALPAAACRLLSVAARGVLEADGGAADPAWAAAAAAADVDVDGCVGTAACAAAVREAVPCLADEPTEKQ